MLAKLEKIKLRIAFDKKLTAARILMPSMKLFRTEIKVRIKHRFNVTLEKSVISCSGGGKETAV